MRKFLTLFLILASLFCTQAQNSITLTFASQLTDGSYQQLDSVTIENLNRNWQETIYFPDTVYTLNVGTDIHSHSLENTMQVMPNPFKGNTRVNIHSERDVKVQMQVTDINGRKCAAYNGVLQAGDNLFSVSLATPQSYILVVRTSDGVRSLKMENIGHAGNNSLEYLGAKTAEPVMYLKSSSTHNFQLGDVMRYTGYATVNGLSQTSQSIIQSQTQSESITLFFTGGGTTPTLPFVTTTPMSDISSTTATGGGTVFSDGGATVFVRGVCWSAGHNPLANGNHTSDGSGTGSFTSFINGLVPNTTYYVRAYATNSVGTAYGEEIEFTTSCEGMQLTISGDTSLTFGGSATLTVSGATSYLWSTGATTPSITVLPTTSMIYSVTGTNPDGCTATASVLVSVYPILPTVVTTTISNITDITAIGGGQVLSDGGAMVSARGVCWATATNPTVAGSHTTNGTGTGLFTSTMTGLVANTTYYVRAYATNSAGTAYGEEMTFITSGPAVFDCGTSLLYDYDGNTYSTVLLGTQCWMAENLRTTHFSDGTEIPIGTTSSPYVSYRYIPNNDAINVPTYGYLYNQSAVIRGSMGGSQSNPSGVQGVCPTGWHVPSRAEWVQLNYTIMAQPQYWCNNSIYNFGKALCYTSGWMNSSYNCAIGNNQSSNNATGFGVRPAGAAYYNDYDFYGLGRFGLYWCSDVYSDYSDYGVYIAFEYNDSEPWDDETYRSVGMSVRCLQDRLPVVTTAQVNSVTFTTAVCGGEITNSGASAITARGVCWSTNNNPTIIDNVTNDGIGTGNYTSAIAGLTEGTVYYVRAYASNSFGTSYGEVFRFVTKATPPAGDNIPCPGIPTVTDVDGNVYNTVKIGGQCWMKENMRTSHYPDGTLIPLGSSSSSSYTTAYRYYPGDNVANVSQYGYHYNWRAATNGLTGSDDNPSCLQGICPNGWHVPSAVEWTTLTDYVSSQPYYRCNGYSSAIARALASSTGWNHTSGECYIGSDTNSENRTGFNALPAGSSSSYSSYTGSNAYFWTATPSPYYSPDYPYEYEMLAHYLSLSYNNSEIVSTFQYNSYNYAAFSQGYSVRCVHDSIYLPTVTTDEVTDSSTNAAVCSATVVYSGGADVYDRGFCWSTSHNPTVESSPNSGPVLASGFVASYDFLPGQEGALAGQYANNEDYQSSMPSRSSNTSLATGRGTFTYTIYGLQPNTTYYVRAYATNTVGTSYGEELSFNTLPVPEGDAMPCPGVSTVTDYDGNVYNTVKIGNQCWLKENLRSTHYSDGTYISIQTYSNQSHSDTSSIYPRRYYPNGSSTNVAEYGYLYNWAAVMHGGSATNANPSGLQGICPEGWHVPSESEWTQLTSYISGQDEYYGQSMTKILASQFGWTTDNSSSNVIGTNAYKNNATGFSAMPAGYYHNTGSTYSTYYHFYTTNFGTNAYFWNSSPSDYYYNTHLYGRGSYFSYASYGLYYADLYKYNALSVRCVQGIGYNLSAVTTTPVHSITDSTAVVGGDVTYDGGDAMVERGICWNYTGMPTLADQYVACGTGTGEFSTTLSNLSNNTVYYVRAYATNPLGTTYGEVKAFKTPIPVPQGDAQPCPGTPTVTDIDGNVYNTVKIGEQCWMKENLRTLKQPDGTDIANGTSQSLSYTIPYYYVSNNNATNVDTYGYLYNWAATMNLSSQQNSTQGICPAGWHIPSLDEWNQLTNYLSDNDGFFYNYVQQAPAKALASVFGWYYSSQEGTPGFDTLANNTSGFSMLPVGYYTGNNSGYLSSFGITATIWTRTLATDYGYDDTYALSVSCSRNSLFPSSSVTPKSRGYSVRCLKTSAPQVTTVSTQPLDNNSVLAEGLVTTDGGTSVTACGFCWNTTSNPTIADNHSTSSLNGEQFTGVINNLTDSTTYYVRAYATNSEGTSYGNEIEIFYTFSCGSSSIVDADGNIYNTVLIGNQCWMKENLRTTHYEDGTVILMSATTNDTIPYRYAPNNDTNNVATYGYLYNWAAVMHGKASSTTIPSAVQGICPNGWHMPSDSEWTQLTSYVSSQSEYLCNGYSTYIAKALAASTGWTSYSNVCSPGTNFAQSNATGFSALPSGYYNNGPSSFGATASFWTCTRYSSSNVYYNSISYNSTTISHSSSNLTNGRSVRCIRNFPIKPTVATLSVINVFSFGADCDYTVVEDGGAPVTARGVCWSTSPNPTILNNHTVDGIDAGSYTSSISGLTANTTYYVRAYATNEIGTAYGNQISFTTPSSIPYTTNFCNDNNWTLNNGSNTNYWRIGTIPATNTCGLFVTTNSSTPGYNEHATSLVTAERVLNIGRNSELLIEFDVNCGGESVWDYLKVFFAPDTVSYIPPESGSSPTWSNYSYAKYALNFEDYRSATTNYYSYTDYWFNLTDGNTVHISAVMQNPVTNPTDATLGKLVFLWKNDDISGTQPGAIITNVQVTPITCLEPTNLVVVNADTVSANISWTARQNETEWLFEYKNSSSNIWIPIHVYNDPEISINNLTPGNAYHVRVRTVCGVGDTSFATQTSFIVPKNRCPNAPTVTDIDGNIYNTVQIGDQCWMKENLRTTRYSDGTLIAEGTDLINSTPYRYAPKNNMNTVSANGYLYNWPAAMHNASSSMANPSGVQGICPTGWHLPSKAEWTQLLNFVNGQSQYLCNNNNNSIAKALAAQTGWNASTYYCSPGQDPTSNNATGFSATPAGQNTSNSDFGSYACFHSSSANNSSGLSYVVYLGSTSSNVNTTDSYYYQNALSVRCLRDNGLAGVTITNVNNDAYTTLACECETFFGNSEGVISKGVCWSNSANPTISNNHTAEGGGTGTFTSTISGLSPGTTYHIRAYATTIAGTNYSDEVVTITHAPIPAGDGQSCPGVPIVTDIDLNTYNTVQIGNQCWMKENLRTTRYANGISIAAGTTTSETVAYRYAPNNVASNVETYGYLYNWPAVMHGASGSNLNPSGVQGICPTGWHVPSDAEWTQLTDYVVNTKAYFIGHDTNNIAKALASQIGWSSSSNSFSPGNESSSNNSTGFSAIPASGYTGSYYGFGQAAYMWSSTESNSWAWYRQIQYSQTNVMKDDYNKYYAYSVRCIHDNGLAGVESSDVNSSDTSLWCTTVVSFVNSAGVLSRGVCWSTSPNPTISDNHTTNGSGTGIFTTTISGLNPGSTYHIRPYATTSAGTNYGNDIIVYMHQPAPAGIGQPCPGNPTVTDIDLNTYNTVQIGNQCWMKENLRTTRYSDGTIIAVGTTDSDSIPFRYAPNNIASNVSTYGYLYNWPAVMHGSSSSNVNPSGVQGICPTGWHVPSDAEWTQLTNYVYSTRAYFLSNDTNRIAKALASQSGWTISTYFDTPGYEPSTNNATGFSVVPAGYCGYGSYYSFGSEAYFWSSTEDSYGAWSRAMSSNGNGIVRIDWYNRYGYSVRCLRD